MCAPSPPPAPDYAGAAVAQGVANKETAIAQSVVNNPNVVNPYGTQTWTPGATPDDRSTLTQTFSPEQQALYDQSNQTKLMLGGLGQQGATALQGVVGNAVDFSGVTPRPSSDFTSGAPSAGLFSLSGNPAFGSTDFTAGSPEFSSTDFSAGSPAFGSTNFTAGAPGLSSSNFGQGAEKRASSNISGGALASQNFSGGPALASTDFTTGSPELKGTDFTSGAPQLGSTNLTSGVSAMPGSATDTRNQVFDAMMSRVNEDYNIKRNDDNSNLIAAGIRPGSTAYNDQMQQLQRGQNDARQQAILASGQEASRDFGLDMSRRQQGVSEAKDIFSATSQARAQMTDEQRAQFDASLAARSQVTGEKQAEFDASSRARSQLSAEKQAEFDASARANELAASQQQASFNASLAGRAQDIAAQQAQFAATQGARGQYTAEQQAQTAATAAQRAQMTAEQRAQFDATAAQRAQMTAEQQAQYVATAAQRGQMTAEQQAQFAADQAARGQYTAEQQAQFGAGSEARRQDIAELLAQRQTPLNEINALMSGSQVSNPFAVPGAAQNTQINPAPTYNAALQAGQYGTDVYNAQVGQQNSLMGGLFGLGGAALMSPVGRFTSDRRLKSNIVRIGTHPLGIGIYEYDIFGKRDVGVMAQELIEVMPDAVVTMPNGYMAVRYDMIGGQHG